MELDKVQKKVSEGAWVMFIREIHEELTLYIWEKSLRSDLTAVYKYFHREKKPDA